MTHEEFQKLTSLEKIQHNLPAITALCNGEEIELLNSNEKYYPYHHVYYYNPIQYPLRVKPKTVKKWFNIYISINCMYEIHGYGYDTRGKALKEAAANSIACIELEVPLVS